MATRVYKYGLIPIGYPPQVAIDELFRANNLWNTLVALHRESRENWDDARRSASILYSEKMDELDKKNEDISEAFNGLNQARMDEGTKDETGNKRLQAERAIINRLTKEQKEIYAELNPLRKEADKTVDKKALNDEYRKKCNTAVSAKVSGVYSRTAGELYAYFRTARDKAFKDKTTLRFHRFDGTGYFAFRCRSKAVGVNVDGISVEDFMSKQFIDYLRCAVQSVDESRKKPRIRINAVLTGGRTTASKVFQEFDWIYHRPLPPEGQIQNGKILRTRVGDKFKYDLVLTVKLPDVEMIKPAALNGTIGIDVGFRKVGNSLLIGTVMSSDSAQKAVALEVPTMVVSALEHVDALRSELDDVASDLGKAITPLLKANPIDEEHGKYRLWRSLALRPLHVTLSFEQAYKLAHWLKREPNLFPSEINEKVHTWWRSYSRKYREIHNRRKKQLTHRKHFYRETAAKLVAQNKLIVLEKINLTDFAETKNKNTKLSNKARAQRFMASLGEFRDAIKNAADREGVPVIDVNPAYTSKTCSECGYLNKELKSEKERSCPECGVVHDRDENAANNLQKMGQKYLLDAAKTAAVVVK
jgi:IS605 OrfB family transposase